MPTLERWADAGQDADDDLDDHLGEQEPTHAPASPGGVPCSLDNAALAELIGRIMHQDEAAMAALYDTLWGRVYAVAWIMTMARSRALDAQRAHGRDVLQSLRHVSRLSLLPEPTLISYYNPSRPKPGRRARCYSERH